MKNKAVFIDRDDTIARDVPYCSRPEDFELLPGVGEGLRQLKAAGFKIIVVTNQSGIARGFLTPETLDKIHDKMRTDLDAYNTGVDAIYYCPHHPDDGCECRKPSPKMIFDAASDLDIDISRSYVIGDRQADVEMGVRAGCKKCFKIFRNDPADAAFEQFDSFLKVVELILDYEK
jgi:histidinol-phosphate phosphatase family protein